MTGLDLRQTDVVALPAGLTALDDVGAMGLPRGFLLAGARAVVADLWQPAEGARRELLVNFYRRVLTGRPTAAALRESQLSLRGVRADPAVWGGLVCFSNGDAC